MLTLVLHLWIFGLWLFAGALVLTGINRLMNHVEGVDDTLGQLAQEMGPAIFSLFVVFWPVSLFMVLTALLLSKLEEVNFGETPEWVVKLADKIDALIPGSKVE